MYCLVGTMCNYYLILGPPLECLEVTPDSGAQGIICMPGIETPPPPPWLNVSKCLTHCVMVSLLLPLRILFTPARASHYLRKLLRFGNEQMMTGCAAVKYRGWLVDPPDIFVWNLYSLLTFCFLSIF